MNQSEVVKPLDEYSHAELQNKCVQIYERLSNATSSYILAQQEHDLAKRVLAMRFGVGILNGTIVGKNETEREAMAREQFAAEYEEVDRTKDALAAAELEIQLAKIDERGFAMAVKIFSFVLEDSTTING